MPKEEAFLDFDAIDEGEDEVEVLQPKEEEKKESANVSPEIFELLKRHKEQTMTYVDQRMVKMQEQIKTNTQTLESHTQRLDGIEKSLVQHTELLQALAVNQQTQQQQMTSAPVEPIQDVPLPQMIQTQQNGSGIIDTTLGTVGNVAHGLVDTVAFLCESAIDLVTLGKARRTH